MKKIISTLFGYALFLLPVVALAADDDLGEITTTFQNIMAFINDTLIPLVFALALLMFLYGVFKYFIVGSGDESKRQEGRQMMLYSIIGFVAMVAIFGLVNIVANGLGLTKDNTKVNMPSVPGFEKSGTNNDTPNSGSSPQPFTI